MKLSEENIREKKFHNELQSKQTGRFENIFYKAIYNANEDFFNYLKVNDFRNGLILQQSLPFRNFSIWLKFNEFSIFCIWFFETIIHKIKALCYLLKNKPNTCMVAKFENDC